MKKKSTRNPVAQNRLLGKGGVHEKPNKAKRQRDKQQLKKNVRAGDETGPFLFPAALR